MNKYIKAQFSALAATLADFLTTAILTEVIGIWYLISSGLGAMTGAVLGFTLGRRWVFKTEKQARQKELYRYSLFWIGNFTLNLTGTWFLTETMHQPYLFSKCIIAVIVGLSYSYYVQKLYVFIRS